MFVYIPKDDIHCPARVTGSCDPSEMSAGNKLHLLQEQGVLWTTD